MNKSSLKQILPSYLLLILLPCVFGLFLYFFILEIDKNHELENIKTSLSDRAVDFIAKTAAEDYFHPYLDKLADSLMPFIENRAKDDGTFMTNHEVSKTITDLNKKLGENIRCAIFNEKAILLNPQDLLPYEQRFFTYAWKYIHKFSDYAYKNRRPDQNNIIGDEFNIESLVGYNEACVATVCPEKTGVFYFKNANLTNNGLIAFVLYKQTKQELIQAKIKDFSSYDQPIIYYDIKTQQRTTPTHNHKEISYERTNTEEFLNGFIEDDVFWKGYNAIDYKLLLGQRIDLKDKYKQKVIISVIVFLLLVLLSSLFFFRNFSNDKGIYFSIRYKLIFIFAIAVYIPTISLWVLSYASLNDHRIAIENKVKKGLLDILNKIDNDYKSREEEINNCYSKLDTYLKNLKGKPLPSQKEFINKLNEITGLDTSRRIEIFTWLDIRSIDKTQIYTTSSDDSNSRIKSIGRILSVLCLEKYCPERLAYAGVKPSQSDILVGNLLENPVVGFSSMIERPKQLTSQNVDTIGEIYWWWNYYPEKDNPVAFMVGNAINRNVSLSYFKSILKNKYALSNIRIKLICFHNETQSFIPKITNNSKNFRDLIKVSNISKSAKSSVINYKNTNYLCLCIPGSKIKDGSIIGMYPISEIDYQIEKVRSTIYAVIILLLIISILTGSLLAKTFITPVKELNRGLEALRKRETETLISIENKDELGHLGNTFNQMMSEIKDMLMAGAVQRCLIPTGKYELDGYNCIIYNKMANDVGGDYADMFELPDNRLLLVVGDVNGHGVSSSLIAAMVKASVFLFANQNLPLNEIVKNSSYMICDLLGNKMLMKFCAIILDKKTGELSICNAGNPYPFIREKQIGKMRIPTNINLPMGISKARSTFTNESEILNDGETLLLYTDAFIELNSDQKDKFGYENLKNYFLNLPIDSIEETKNHFIDRLNNYLAEKELPDDITFILLRRNPLQNN